MPGVNDWLKKAASDLKASEKLSDDNETFDCSAFHTHQCAEKSLKALIVFFHKSVQKTHDLGVLLSFCIEFDPRFVFLLDDSRYLNGYGQESRYPNDFFYIDKQNVEEAIEKAEKIFLTIKRKLAK